MSTQGSYKQKAIVTNSLSMGHYDPYYAQLTCATDGNRLMPYTFWNHAIYQLMVVWLTTPDQQQTKQQHQQ